MTKKKRSSADALELARKTEGTIDRALEDSTSRQPRFRGDAGMLNVESIFSSVYSWIQNIKDNLPPAYSAHSRKRDAYLMEIWKQESLLSGVLNSVMQIDSNRAWTLTGGRNSVTKATGLLHRRIVASDLVGWRHAVAAGSLAFAATDLGHVEELGRDGENGPITALYFLDSSKCELTGNNKYPLAYFPSGRGSRQDWPVSDYMRCVSMPSGQEEYNGLGFCAVSRCLELARIMIAVYQHDQEQLGAKLPQGLLILNGIDDTQWKAALESRDAEMTQKARQYFGGLFVFAGTDASATLTALSTLPKDFNTREFVDLLMYGYALAFGYDPREFWPVSGGQLGTATETETQHVKATAKGGMAYLNTYQEKLMNHVWTAGDRTFYGILPGGVQFDFEQRDDDAALVEATVAQAWANVAKTLQESGAMTGTPLLSREQALSLLVDHTSLIPPEWTEMEEEVKADDTEGTGDVGRIRRSVVEIPAVRRAIEMNPDEPIIRYRYPANQIQTLWQRGGDAIARRSFPAIGKIISKADVLRSIGIVSLADYADTLGITSFRAVSEETGKFDPAHVGDLDEQGREKVPVTQEDLELAADLWDKAHPEFAGLLRARSVTEEEANGNG